MAEQHTGVDALRTYLTGAGADGGAQADPQASLGAFRSSIEVAQLGDLMRTTIPEVIVQQVYGRAGVGEGLIDGTPDGLRYTPPGGTPGARIAIADGETKVLEAGNDDSAAVRVKRDGAKVPFGEMNLYQLPAVHGVFAAMGTIPGGSTSAPPQQAFAAVMLRTENIVGVANFKAWIDVLAPGSTSNVAQLPGAGAGSITTSGDLSAWPLYGLAHIKDSTGATREIVEYTGRTATTLTVAAAGRGLYGTAAGAGAVDDVIYPVPYCSIGLEDSDASNKIQSIPDLITPPGGIVFSSEIDEGLAIGRGSIDYQDNLGLWIRVRLPNLLTPTAIQPVRINTAFDVVE